MAESNYLDSENCHKATFLEKPNELKKRINETLLILEQLGIDIKSKTPRLKEKTALGFLSLGDMKNGSKWGQLKDITETQRTTREIITQQNKEYGESRSSGSYDDVRREDLKDMVLANIILNTKPKAAKNDPTRKYGISEEYAKVIRVFGTKEWNSKLAKIVKKNGKFVDRTTVKREFDKVPIKISADVDLELSTGKHNELQKSIIEEFLPRFCPNSQVLYLGDSQKKDLINEKKKLKSLGFFELKHGMLPDIVVYREEKNWIYLIEAVHTANPITKNRKVELEDLTSSCKADIIYVSTFSDRSKFRTWVADLAWETEVWIADEPDHLIHFNGHKFLGPY